jgi:hypothetical protein
MLSYFVNIYTNNDQLTPTSILVLFIVSVLGAVWAIATLFTYHRSRNNSHFVAFIDLCFVGAFIAGVWYLRYIQNDNCASIASADYSASLGIYAQINYNGYGIPVEKTCAMLKACWVFGIMNCLFFFITSVLAFFVGGKYERKHTYVAETRYRSSGGHSRRSGSHRSHRSSHSGRRHAYV